MPFPPPGAIVATSMMRQKPRIVALTLAAFLLLTSLAFAQSSSGVIFGRVLDHSGLPVPNADVTLVNMVTRDAMPATTSASGDFVFPTVQPGSYSVMVKAAVPNIAGNSLTIYLNKAATTNVQIGWFVVN